MISKLIKFELKKITSRNVFALIFSLLIVATVFLATMDFRLENGIYNEKTGSVETISEYELKNMEREVIHNFSGQLIDNASVRSIVEKNEADIDEARIWKYFNVSTIFWWINNVGLYEIQVQEPDVPITESVTADRYYQNMLSEQFANIDSEFSEPEALYWRNQIDQIDTPFEWQFGAGWYSFCERCHHYSILAAIFIIIGCCMIFPNEHRYKTDALVLSAQYGRKKIFTAKLISGIIISTDIACIIYGIGLITGLLMYGVEGFSTPLQIFVYESAYNMTFGCASMLLLLLGIVSSIMAGIFVMLISELFRSVIPAIVIPLLLVVLAIIGAVTHQINVFLDYLPIRKIGIQVLSDLHLFKIGAFVINPIYASLFIYVILGLICIPLCKWCYSKYQVGNR